MTLHVVVDNMAGNSLALDFVAPKEGGWHCLQWPCAGSGSTEPTIWLLKEAIARSAWGIPYIFQKLFETKNHEELSELQDSERIVQTRYQLVVSVDATFRRLEREWVDLHVLQAVGMLGSKGGDAAMLAIIAHLDFVRTHAHIHKRSHSKVAALNALAQVAENGNQKAITTACIFLQDGVFRVRIAASDALAHIADKGNKQVIAALCDCLKDRNFHQKLGLEIPVGRNNLVHSCLEALSCVAKKGDEYIINTLIAMLNCASSIQSISIMVEAVYTLAQIADKGNRHAITTICDFLQKVQMSQAVITKKFYITIMCDCLEALAQLAQKGDHYVVSVLSTFINWDDADSTNKEINEALLTLTHIAFAKG